MCYDVITKCYGGIIVFYDRFERLCRENGYTPSGACVAIGRSKNLAAKWKSTGAMPSADVLHEIATFFDVSVDFLLEKEDQKQTRQDVFDRPEMRILFDAAKDAPSSAIIEAALALMKLKESNPD